MTPHAQAAAHLAANPIGWRSPGHSLHRKATACLLALAVSLFPCLPAWAQTASSAATSSAASATPPTSGSAPQQPVAMPATLPAPTPRQAAAARKLYEKGLQALKVHDAPRALKLLSRAHQLNPAETPYLAAMEIARQQMVDVMMLGAAKDQKAGKRDQAVDQLRQALKVDPGNPYVQEHLLALADEQAPAVARSTPMPEFTSGVIQLEPTAERATFHLRAKGPELIQRVFSAYGINTIVDDSVGSQVVRLDLDNATFQDAKAAVQLLTDSFTVALDPQRALVAKDTRENRLKFERLLLETVYLPGLSPKEMADPVNLVKNVFGVRQVSVRPNNGTLSIRATESTLRAVNATLSRLFVEKPEVVIDVHVYQVNNSRQQTLGAQFPQQLTVFNVPSELTSVITSNQSTISELVSSGLVNPGDLAAIAGLLVGLGLANGSILSQPFALFGNGLTLSGLSFGPATANASLNIANTRQLDHVQLRAGDSDPQTFLFGSRYPVITQSYSATPGLGATGFPGLSSFAGLGGFPGLGALAGLTGGLNTQVNPLATAPQVQFQNLGLTLKAKATVLGNDEVQMSLQVKIDALAGASINGVPVINNRSFTTTVRVHDGGSALVVSSVNQQEVKSLSGIPGLSELPGLGWTASPSTSLIVGDLLVLVTPRIVSPRHRGVATPMLMLNSNPQT